MASSHIGECKLCQAVDARLMDSHILSKWTYRRASDPKRTNGSQSPVRVGRGVVVQTSQEIKEHLLCFDCEQSLGRDEDYVSRLAYQPDGTLGLFGQLPAGALIEVPADRFLAGTIKGASLASFDRLKLGRFAASIFWRAHVSSRYDFKALKLWSPQAEALRRYIRGEASLPRGMCMTMFALAPGDDLENVHNTTTVSPTSEKTGENSKHLFAVPGLLFLLSTGSEAHHRLCLDGPSPHALIRSWRDYGIFRQVSDLVRSSTPKGRLARR